MKAAALLTVSNPSVETLLARSRLLREHLHVLVAEARHTREETNDLRASLKRERERAELTSR